MSTGTSPHAALTSKPTSLGQTHVSFENYAPEVVAEISHQTIAMMADEELIDLIRDISPPFLDEAVLGRLPYFDRARLEQLAHLTRRYCWNVCAAHH